MPGATACRINIAWDIHNKNRPWINGKISPAFISFINNAVDQANIRGMIAVFVLDGVPKWRRKTGFNNHSLNAENGGPVKIEKTKNSAVKEFYTNPEVRKIYKSLLFEISKLKGKLEVMVLWENYNGWRAGGFDFACDMCKYWSKIDTRIIGTGNQFYRDARQLHDYMMSLSYAQRPKFYIEPYNYEKFKEANRGYENMLQFLDWQFVGIWPSKKLMMRESRETKEGYFRKNEIDNAIEQLEDNYRMIVDGMGPSYQFGVFSQPDYWKRNYNVSTGDYDFPKHMKAVNGFFTLPAVKKVIENPEIIKSDAGRKAFLMAALNYRKKLKKQRINR